MDNNELDEIVESARLPLREKPPILYLPKDFLDWLGNQMPAIRILSQRGPVLEFKAQKREEVVTN